MLLVYPRQKQTSDICQYWLNRLNLVIGSGVLTEELPGEFAYSKHLYGPANMRLFYAGLPMDGHFRWHQKSPRKRSGCCTGYQLTTH